MAAPRLSTFIDLRTPTFRPPSLGLTPGWFPRDGVVYSILLHGIVIALLLLISETSIVVATPADIIRNSASLNSSGTELVAPAAIVYQGGLEDAGDAGAGTHVAPPPAHHKEAAVGHRDSPAAVAWDGPVPIVSAPRVPDQNFQTIHHADLVRPPKLRMPVPLPVAVVVTGTPSLPVPPPPADVHQLRSVSIAQFAPAAPPAPPKPVVPDAPPVTTDTALKQGKDLLVLNAIVAMRAPEAIPDADTAGKFVVRPEEKPGNSPGATGQGADVKAAVTATAAKNAGLHGDEGKAPSRSDTGPTGGSDTMVVTAANPAASSGGATSGTGSGHGATGGAAGSSGSGNMRLAMGGAPGASGTAPSIRITGGSVMPPARRGPPSLAPKANYGLTIVGLGAAGGGIHDLGVFHNETVYTVYIDLTDAGHRVPGCTLQYAFTKPERAVSARDKISPPFTTSNPYPTLAADVRSRFHGRSVIVYATLGPQGELGNVKVMESPNDSISTLVLKTLTRWVFQPAEVNGSAVPVKVLLAFPIA